MEKKDNSTFAIFSLILGIFSLFAWLLPICGLPLAIVGVIFGSVSKESSRPGMAKAGLITSIIGLVLGVVNAAIGVYLGVTGQLFNF